MIKEIDYKKQAKLLKARGLINIDLRKKLTPQKKSAITRAFNRNKKEIQFEEKIKFNSGGNGEFAVRTVKSTIIKKQLRAAGYLVEGNKAYINKDGYKNIRIEKGFIYRSSKGRSEKEILFRSDNKVDELKHFSDSQINTEDSWKAVRIGNFSPVGFSTRRGKYKNTPLHERPASAQRFDDFDLLLNYVNNWQPRDVEKMDENDQRKLKNQLINSMSFVTIDRSQFSKCKKCKKNKNSLNEKGICNKCSK